MDINEFNQRLDKIWPAFEKEFQKRVEQRTPVHTGLLKDSWLWEGNKDSRDFTNEQDYAIYPEYGTTKMRPVAMVGTTIKESEDILKKATKDAGL